MRGPLLCKLSTRQIAQTPDNEGIARESAWLSPYEGGLNHPIVSVPNQPEIPAFVASVFSREGYERGETRWTRKKRTKSFPKELAKAK